MELYKLYSDFYNLYFDTRKIKNGPTHSLEMVGYVLDATTDESVKNATINFILKNSTEVVLTKKSAEKGYFKVDGLDEGIP